MLKLSLMRGNDVAIIGGTHHIEVVSMQVLLVHVHIWVVQFLVVL
jgi:hypothetical protein